MKGVSFLVSFCDFLGVVFSLFPDLGLALVVKGGPGSNKMEKEKKAIKKGVRNGETFDKKSVFFIIVFPLFFGRVSGSFF